LYFRRLKLQLKLTWLPFAIRAIFKSPQSNCKICSGMPLAARQPFYLASSVHSVNLVLLDLLSLEACSRLLAVRTFSFSSDSSRKWQSPWSVAQNLSRSWRRAKNASFLFQDIILFRRQQSLTHCRFTHSAKIGESATRPAILPSAISPPS
jgi:hypothetical protein